jgi:hypothetical protein
MRRSLGTDQDGARKGYRTFNERSSNRLGYGIVFKFKNGTRRLFEYSDLVDAEYNPDLGGIILEGIGKRITMLGTNLVGLFDEIADHQLGEVIEQHEPPHMEAELAKQSEPYIRELIWERLSG